MWKNEIIKKYLPNISFENYNDKTFSRFIQYAKKYKQKYGNIDIKVNDTIENYKIGIIFSGMKQRKNIISQERKKELEELGIFLDGKHQMLLSKKMILAKEAIEHGVIISHINQKYKEVDLYNWIKSTIKRKYDRNNLSNIEIEIIEKLIGKSLSDFFKHNNLIKVVDMIKNEEVTICNTQEDTRKLLSEQIGIPLSIGVIRNRLYGKVTTPYKGRFMFYYATDEEIKKYLEDNKEI